jgi:uncharacterized protein (TIGR02099 family)
MERKRRRVWTFIISAAALLVIGAALASGLFQLAVQAVPGYRADVERYVKDVTGRPVRIGALGLTWRYYYPALELQQVALLDTGGAVQLEAERLRLGFGLMGLIRGEFIPSRLELSGLTLDARLSRDGHLEISGLQQSGGGEFDLRETLRSLEAFSQLQIERCRLNLADERRGETWSFGVSRAELERGLLGVRLEADLTLPAAFGESAQLEASVGGDWLEPATWSGNWAVKVNSIAAGSWLTPYLARGAQVEVHGAEALLRGETEDGRVTTANLWLRTGPLSARRAQHVAALESLEARVLLEFGSGGWTARLKQIELDSVNGSWPPAPAQLQYTGGEQPALEGQLEFLRLADLAPWLQMLREPGALAALDKISGELRDVQFRVQGTDPDDVRYSLQARFEGLALPAADRAAGFAGARGELAADEAGGRAIFSKEPVTVELPGLLISPAVPFEALEGEIEWRKLSDGWKLNAPRFQWELLSTRGNGRLELLLPESAQRSPEINLSMQFSADDVTAAKPLMPKHWGPGLINWLDRSIISGRATKADLTIAGRLADFPFEGKPGIFSLDIEAQDILLAYQPDWPPVEQLGARLSFRGNSLAIASTSGSIGGNTIKTVAARFPDFSTAELVIDGTVEGETERFYQFLARSPLRVTLAGLLRSTTAQGPAAVDIHLDIPLDRASGTQARGVVTLGGVELRHTSLPEPVRNIQGQLSFGGKGIASERISGNLFAQPLVATITPKPDGSSLLGAGFTFAPGAPGTADQGLIRFVPAWLLQKLSGASDWRAELKIAGDGDTPVRLSSNLSGMAIRLPPPLGKTAEQTVPLVLTVGDAPQVPLRITVDYQDRFGADLHFARRGNETRLSSGALRVGAGPPIPAPASGVILGGALAEMDVRQWADELKGSGLEQQASLFRRADLNIGRAHWGAYSVGSTRYQWLPQTQGKGGWLLTLTGAGGAGELRWNPQGRGVLTARLDQLALDYSEPAAGQAQPSHTPADPSELPRFDLDVRRLSLNQADMGGVLLATALTESGQEIQNLKVAGGLVTLGGTGEWQRRSGQSSATLDFDFASGDIGALLRALGYAPTLEAKSAAAKGALRWRPAAAGLEWQQAQGTVNHKFADGQLRAVKPGVGRVLGLFNFYALPRRLTLNFKDVLGSGLGFDRIQGDFSLADGNAHTENLQIAGPSLRMDVRGRIGLAARDYDQSVTVYPDMSAGVTLGALALGGPVAGVLALIAQELMNKPLDQVTQLSYRVTGSWDDPQVERAEELAPVSERRSGPPSQQR